MAGRVWTTKRKWLGNLVPLGCMLPFAAAGVWLMVRTEAVTVAGIALCLGSLLVGWIAVERFGFFGNAALERELQRSLLAKAGKNRSHATFVGFARPSYVGLLDAHEDLGFLFLEEDRLEFLGEIHHVAIPRADVLGVRYRPNIHSFLGLGRWVSVEARVAGKPARLLIEPREDSTLLASRRRGTRLRAEIESWRKKSGSGT